MTGTTARMRRNRAAILSVPCPRCMVLAWYMCVTPTGVKLYQPHAARRSAAADAGVYVP